MPKSAIFAMFTAQPGKRDELAAAFQPMIEAVGPESGTEVYVMHTGEDAVWFYECYSDGDAMKAHAASEALKEVFARTAELTTGRPQIVRGTPIEGKGVAV
jgi:quinol monooxygenase YgiN